MDAFKISVKFYVQDDSKLAAHEFVPMLHSWIQNKLVTDHLLIDVADYAHVHNGPGTVLVADEANFYTDRTDGRLGLTYSRKRPIEGSFADRLRQAITGALDACARLEADERLAGRIKFKTDEFLVRLDDRLRAPNTDATWQEVRPDLERVAGELYGAGVTVDLEHYPAPNMLFEARVQTSDAPPVITLLYRLGAAAGSATSTPA